MTFTAATDHIPYPKAKQERQMENFDELAIEELTDDELNLVSGGWMTQLIHMDYNDMNNFNDPTAVRYA
jgi:bacteriocin-like protein